MGNASRMFVHFPCEVNGYLPFVYLVSRRTNNDGRFMDVPSYHFDCLHNFKCILQYSEPKFVLNYIIDIHKRDTLLSDWASGTNLKLNKKFICKTHLVPRCVRSRRAPETSEAVVTRVLTFNIE